MIDDSTRIAHNQKIAVYHDETILAYKYWWTDPKTLSSHAGIWEKGVRTHQEAHRAHNRLLAERAGISGQDRVLDAGCGMGGSALALAETYGAHVEGITLSSGQLREARHAAAQRRVEHLVNFSLQDYSATNFEPASFDVIWASESVCYLLDKSDFLLEAFRLLRPGGRLVIADYFRRTRPFLNGDEQLLLRMLNNSAIPDLDTPEEFYTTMNTVGFRNLSFDEYSDEVEPSMRKMYHFARLTSPLAPLIYRLGLISKVVADGAITNQLVYEVYRRKLVRYLILLAHRP